MKPQNKILVVDDDQVNLEFFQVMLSKLGYEVEQANDGLEVLALLKRFHPNLILLDNIMPKMSGWELTKILKNDPKYQGIPIIMFSALDDVKDKLAGFELGIDDYITKPFNFSEVLARIKTVLRNKELLSQLAEYESRLRISEELSSNMRQCFADTTKGLQVIASAITPLQQGKKPPKQKELSELIGKVLEKIKTLRKHIADLEAHVEKSTHAWENIQQDETTSVTAETPIQQFLSQD